VSLPAFRIAFRRAIFVPACCAVFFGSLNAQTAKPTAIPVLQVASPVISQFEDGAAIPAGQKLVSGETVFFRFAAQGFKTSESRVQLTGHAQAFDPDGKPIMPVDEVVISTSLREEDKDWKPVLRFQFQIPPIARPGTYRVQYQASDDQTKKTASAETTFAVSGIDVPASPTLVIRGLGFYRTADDETPLRVAAYRAGDMVWMKFDATGFKYGEQNAIDVSYDVAVTSAEGKPLFSQQDAAVERSQAFYPQPWVPGAFSLTLQPNMRQGEYNVEITARDGVGNQTAKVKASFRVE
jgi:hypothetical protein